MDAINKVMDEYKIDEDRVVIVGFSEGAYVAWQLGMRNADAFRGIVPVAGILEWPNVADVEAEDVANLRVCIMVGGDDRSELVDAAKAAAKKLEEAKAKVRLNVYEDVGHDLPKNAVEEQVKALKFILGD